MTDLLWTRTTAPRRATLLLAHGAGAGMATTFMETVAKAVAARGIDVARFEFDYMASRRHTGKKTPPPRAEKLIGEYLEAVGAALGGTDGPLLIGGKSMGGRVAAMVAGDAALDPRVVGVVCLGYPFHPPGKPDQWRLEPLANAQRPVLIAQGTRDLFGGEAEISALTLPASVRLHWFADGNHDLAPRKASGLTQERHLTETAERIADFAHGLAGAA